MSKNRQSTGDAPPVNNMDELAYLGDEELGALAGRLEGGRQRSRDPRPWEVEIAYVRREQQLRRRRADAHSEWLRSAPRFEVPENEAFEDEADA